MICYNHPNGAIAPIFVKSLIQLMFQIFGMFLGLSKSCFKDSAF